MAAASLRDQSRGWSRFGPGNFAVWLPAGFLLFLIVGAWMKHLPWAVPAAYVACSLLSGALYAQDKARARREARRTPELTLHGADLLGGWPGGLIAQRFFRHKTRKISFLGIFWVTAALHVAAWGWIFVRVPPEPDSGLFVKRIGQSIVKPSRGER